MRQQIFFLLLAVPNGDRTTHVLRVIIHYV
jgi:hypothetical protein